MTKKKKVIRKFWEIDEMFLGKCRNPAKIWPPVCEVLDPLDRLVVRGFLPSAIAVSRLRRLIPISPPNKKYPPH